MCGGIVHIMICELREPMIQLKNCEQSLMAPEYT